MVGSLEKDGKTFYFCIRCKLFYMEKRYAVKCEKWCSIHHNACNLEIGRHAVVI